MSILDKFTKNSSKTPLDKLTNQISNNIEQKLENSVNDFFSRALNKTGLSSSVASVISSRFGDSLNIDLADKYFRTSTIEQNRISCDGIQNSINPRYAETVSESIKRLENKSTSKDVYQFPSQIGKYYMIMKFREYTRTAPQAQAKMSFKNSIILPIPRKLEERFDLNVSDEATGITGAIADVIQQKLSEGGDQFDTKGSDLGLAYIFAMNTLKGAVGDTQINTLQSYLGSIPNPHLATFFNGVQMRSHNFEWTFTPRNPSESRDLQEIVTKLKQNSLPAFSPSGGTQILQYPYLCIIELHPWEKDNSPLIKYKPALLRSVNINYSPNGIPSFFAGTTLPTFISISLNFVETEYFTSNDFGRSGRTGEEGDKIGQFSDFIDNLSIGDQTGANVRSSADDLINKVLGNDNG